MAWQKSASALTQAFTLLYRSTRAMNWLNPQFSNSKHLSIHNHKFQMFKSSTLLFYPTTFTDDGRKQSFSLVEPWWEVWPSLHIRGNPDSSGQYVPRGHMIAISAQGNSRDPIRECAQSNHPEKDDQNHNWGSETLYLEICLLLQRSCYAACTFQYIGHLPQPVGVHVYTLLCRPLGVPAVRL